MPNNRFMPDGVRPEKSRATEARQFFFFLFKKRDKFKSMINVRQFSFFRAKYIVKSNELHRNRLVNRFVQTDCVFWDLACSGVGRRRMDLNRIYAYDVYLVWIAAVLNVNDSVSSAKFLITKIIIGWRMDAVAGHRAARVSTVRAGSRPTHERCRPPPKHKTVSFDEQRLIMAVLQ